MTQWQYEPMVDAAGPTVYSYTAGNQLFTEDGPFASDTVIHPVRNVHMQHSRFPNYHRLPPARVSLRKAFSHGAGTYANRMRVGLAVQQPTGSWTNGFGFDLARRLTNVTMAVGSFGYSYGASPLWSGASRPNRILLPNGSFITNTYDSTARTLSTSLKNSANTVLDSYAYIYNPANQRTNLTRTDGNTAAYSYDAIGQLTIADSSVNSFDMGYHYDAAWNVDRRTNNGVTSTFTVDTKNQLVTCPDGQAGYDANGNLSMTTSPTTYGFTYDDENRLTSAKSGTSWRSDFVYPVRYVQPVIKLGWRGAYSGIFRHIPKDELSHGVNDGQGRMRTRTDFTWNGTNWVAGSTTQYIYDGKLVVEERVSGTPTVAYTRGIDLSGSLEGAGGIGGLLARSSSYASGNFTNHNYYHADANGNITYLVNGSQTMAASYRYDSFGKVLSALGILSIDNTYRFSSKETHVSSGFNNFLYRWYAPNLQRWINRDPIGELGGINLYSTAGNSPTDWIDPFGLNIYPPGFVGPLVPGDTIANPLLPTAGQVPAGYNPNWPTGMDPRGPYVEDPVNGRKFYPHPEDRGHWPHYDYKDKDGKRGRYPKYCKKPWPGQKRPPYGDQSPTNPWPPPRTSLGTSPSATAMPPVLVTPGVPGLPTYPVTTPVTPVVDPVILDPILVP